MYFVGDRSETRGSSYMPQTRRHRLASVFAYTTESASRIAALLVKVKHTLSHELCTGLSWIQRFSVDAASV